MTRPQYGGLSEKTIWRCPKCLMVFTLRIYNYDQRALDIEAPTCPFQLTLQCENRPCEPRGELGT